MLDWMKHIKYIIKNTYGHTNTHDEHKLLILVLINSIKLCMDESLEYCYKYVLILTWNHIGD